MSDTELRNDTYTFTARSADDPARVLTFTLSNGHMHLNLTGIGDQLAGLAEAEERREEIKEQWKQQAKPATLKAMENVSGPLHIRDVDVDLDGSLLTVKGWKRAGGLRLFPLFIQHEPVDNVDAAASFRDEVERRQQSVENPGKFLGPLDYWLGWVALLAGLLILLRRPGRNS